MAQARDKHGLLALSVAAQEGSEPTLEALLALGAPVNGRGSDGRTALHQAVQANRPGLIPLLAAKGANLVVRDNSGWTSVPHLAPLSRAHQLTDRYTSHRTRGKRLPSRRW